MKPWFMLAKPSTMDGHEVPIEPTEQNVAHLLRRAAWGGRPSEIAAATGRGIESTVERLFDIDVAPVAGSPYRSSVGQEAFSGVALQFWWYGLAVNSATPAIERLAWFWHGHFATSLDKVEYADLLHSQLLMLRRLGLGRFDDLLLGVTHDTAMNIYLDLHLSVVGSPNENYARELMELFSMGAGNGYTQFDVEEAARALTGHALVDPAPHWRPLATELRPELHDFGEKVFLGRRGNLDATDIVDAIVATPECGRFLCGRLWHRYAGTRPTTAALDAMVTAFSTRFTVIDALSAMLTHPDFYTDEVKDGLVLHPVELLVRTWRNFELELLDVSGQPIDELEKTADSTPDGWSAWTLEWLSWEIGQRVGYPPNVAGWGHNEQWLDTNGSSARVVVGREVGQLVASGVGRVSKRLRSLAGDPGVLAEAVLRQFGIVSWSSTTWDAVSVAASDLWAEDAVLGAVAVAFASPEVTVA